MTVRSPGHTVLASADSNVYTSVRKRPSSRAERYAIGRALRREVPRKSLGLWRPADDRPDPVDLINQSHEGRLDWLIPVRVGADGQLAVRVPARHRDRDGRGCRGTCRPPGSLR